MRRQSFADGLDNGDDSGDGGDANGAGDLDDGSVGGKLSGRIKPASAAVVVMLSGHANTAADRDYLGNSRRNSSNDMTENGDKRISTTTKRLAMLHRL